MILDYMFTYGGPELLVLFTVFIVTPVVYLCGLNQLRWRYRICAILGLWLAAIAVGFTDVYLIAREARRLCTEEAGLRVYKAVTIEGLAGLFDIEHWQNFGLHYVEYARPGKKVYRETMENGVAQKQLVDEFISDYEYVVISKPLEQPIVKNQRTIQNRTNGEVLAETVGFGFFPGWIDRRLVGALGFAWTAPICDGNYPPRRGGATVTIDDMVRGVVLPISTTSEGADK